MKMKYLRVLLAILTDLGVNNHTSGRGCSSAGLRLDDGIHRKLMSNLPDFCGC